MRATLDDRIRRHLPVVPVPTLPDLRLHLAGPQSGLSRLVADVQETGPPFWAHLWAGGLVLARYLRDHPATVAGKRVLDLGCGCGIVGIAAAGAGARHVLAVDTDPCAVAATRLNACLNDVVIDACQIELLAGEPPKVDVVLVGDLFYEPALALRVATFLDACVGAELTVLVGDPGRAPLPLAYLDPVYRDLTRDFGGSGVDVPATVYAFRGATVMPLSASSPSET